jgi:hypothetical protein
LLVLIATSGREEIELMKRASWLSGVCALWLALVACGDTNQRSSAALTASQVEVTVRGQLVDVDSFSLTRLHSPGELDALESARQAIFDACMADRGFAEPPRDMSETETVYELAYEQAAFGVDAWDVGPPLIRLPDGTMTSGGLAAQPDGCAFEQDAQLGTDPHLREALRYRMMEIRSDADAAAIADERFAPILGQWESCTGHTDGWGLLRAIDSPSSNPVACLGDDELEQLISLRGHHHAQAAATHPEIVAAWIELTDTELANISQ